MSTGNDPYKIVGLDLSDEKIRQKLCKNRVMLIILKNQKNSIKGGLPLSRLRDSDLSFASSETPVCDEVVLLPRVFFMGPSKLCCPLHKTWKTPKRSEFLRSPYSWNRIKNLKTLDNLLK